MDCSQTLCLDSGKMGKNNENKCVFTIKELKLYEIIPSRLYCRSCSPYNFNRNLLYHVIYLRSIKVIIIKRVFIVRICVLISDSSYIFLNEQNAVSIKTNMRRHNKHVEQPFSPNTNQSAEWRNN